MLSKAENERLTRVGPGTAMGELLRHYWHPFLYPDELEPDGPPLRVRLLGEDLIAFRDSTGAVGLLGDHCSHRGASLFYGRNEEGGLRCVYHGWKYDRTGACTDMPNEPTESTSSAALRQGFKHKIRHIAYHCVEQGGMVWAYMGPLDPPPPLPQLEVTLLPPEQRWLSKRVQYSNWVQAMEGEIDQSHNSFLHTMLNPDDDLSPRNSVAGVRAMDRAPHFEIEEKDYGVLIGSGRKAGEDMRYWRLTQWLYPFHTMTGPYGENPMRTWRCWVPMDDENVLVMGANYHPLRPLLASEGTGQNAVRGGVRIRGNVFHIEPEDRAPATSMPYGAWRPKATLENDFFIDREVQRTKTYSGIPEFWAQDGGVQMSMGVINDRSQEHLGTTDLGIIGVRRALLRSARMLQEQGGPPPSAVHPEWYRVRGAAVLISKDASWTETTVEHRKVHPDVNHAGV